MNSKELPGSGRSGGNEQSKYKVGGTGAHAHPPTSLRITHHRTAPCTCTTKRSNADPLLARRECARMAGWENAFPRHAHNAP
eukprot:4726285-Pyramimonas_sp.AAC.1